MSYLLTIYNFVSSLYCNYTMLAFSLQMTMEGKKFGLFIMAPPPLENNYYHEKDRSGNILTDKWLTLTDLFSAFSVLMCFCQRPEAFSVLKGSQGQSQKTTVMPSFTQSSTEDEGAAKVRRNAGVSIWEFWQMNPISNALTCPGGDPVIYCTLLRMH